ncbi:hypothetical protein B0H10DRAFT_11862 [Mycena sp. CBHHK59/15]|nr:hypothetical protein B0H10DRAFT_11862 [Mycena sp. CBHHK59/15]
MSDTKPAESNPSVFVPQPPFDDLGADVILRSSDGVDFHVYRVVLSLASPVFRDMFKLPQPKDDPRVPIVSMWESALVLDRMLRFCYPGAEPVVDTLDQLREILEVALLKYDMQFIVPFGKRYLQAYILLDPVAVFAIACRHEWKDVALQAAKKSLRIPLRAFRIAPPVHLKYITADRYHTLLQYHAECGKVAKAATSSLKWMAYSDELPWLTCNQDPEVCPDDTGIWDLADLLGGKITSWFKAYLRNVGEVLAAAPTARLDGPDLLGAPIKEMVECPFCRQNGFQQLMNFANVTLKSKIAVEVDSVELQLNF